MASDTVPHLVPPELVIHEESATFPTAYRTGSFYTTFFRCRMQQCVFQTRTREQFNIHIEERHHCEHCALFSPVFNNHVCARAGMRGGHADRGANSGIDLSIFKEYSRSNRGAIVTYIYKTQETFTDLSTLMTTIEDSTTTLVSQVLTSREGGISFQLCAHVLFEKENIEIDENHQQHKSYDQSDRYIFSSTSTLHGASNINQVLLSTTSDIIGKIFEFTESGSGWYVKNIISIQIKVGELRLLNPIRGSRHIRLPRWLNSKKGKINITNTDELCFHYCIAASIFMHEKKNVPRSLLSRPSTWESYLQYFDFTGLDGPVDISNDITLFEANNNIAVNILGHCDTNIIIHRISELETTQVVNLFLATESDSGEQVHHFVLITDLPKFTCNFSRNRLLYCTKCLRMFTNQTILDTHTRICVELKGQSFEMPDERDRIVFKRYEMTLPFPFILFYDFECYSTPLNRQRGTSTIFKNVFLPASYGLLIIKNTGKKLHVITSEFYKGEDCVHHFLNRVLTWSRRLLKHIRSTNNYARPSVSEQQAYDAATACSLCGREFSDGIKKVFHHNHISGTISNVGAVCSWCNLKIKYKYELPCIAHNSSGFDLHLITMALDSELFDASNVKVIAKSGEKFIQMEITAYHPMPTDENPDRQMKYKIRFMDSCQFMNTSLATLVSNLERENCRHFHLVDDCFATMVSSYNGTLDSESRNLILKKIDFPYRFLSGPEVLLDTVAMPGREYFNNELTNTEITDDEWQVVQDICTRFNIRNFKSYLRLYNLLDVVLLAVVWENFRMNGINSYQLDPTYCPTISSYSWQCMLFSTGVRIEYMRDERMIDLVQQGIKGGITFGSSKIVTANNEYNVNKPFNPNLKRSHIVYFDINALYSTALCKKYPISDYEWLEEQDLTHIDWKNPDIEPDKGYILKVSLGYPDSIHDEFREIPLAPEKVQIKIQELSDRQRQQIVDLPEISKSFLSKPRLLLTCNDKKEYVVHFKLLQYYLQQGMILQKVHCGFKFTHASFFKPYIEDNLEKRRNASNASKKDLFKLNNNSIYGKTLQNSKDYIEVAFCKSRVMTAKLISSPRCLGFKSLSPTLSMVLLLPAHVYLNMPFHIGETCLDWSKLIYYTRFYQGLKPIFGNDLQSFYCDTDSVITHIESENNDLFQKLVDNKDLFDFSKIPPNHLLFQQFPDIPDLRTRTAGNCGIWKIESLDIAEAVVLKAKQYSLLYNDETFDIKSRGTPKATLKTCTHEQLKAVVEQNSVVKLRSNYIRSFDHRLYLINVEKISFHCLDVNRVYPDLNNVNYSLPFGHYRVRV